MTRALKRWAAMLFRQCSLDWALTAPSARIKTPLRLSATKLKITLRVTLTTTPKSGTVTVSHLRFGPKPIKAPYLISEGEATFVGCHQLSFVDRFDMLKYARKGSVFLLNSIYGPDEVWDTLPKQMQRDLIEKEIEFYVIDAYSVAEKTGMGQRITPYADLFLRHQ